MSFPDDFTIFKFIDDCNGRDIELEIDNLVISTNLITQSITDLLIRVSNLEQGNEPENGNWQIYI